MTSSLFDFEVMALTHVATCMCMCRKGILLCLALTVTDGVQLKEGLIEEGTELWDSLSVNDQNKRRHAGQETKLKLKSPNFFVSLTRLHIINIPPSWDEKKLKESCRQAVQERASKLRPKVKQAVILRDATRLDTTNNSKSRGIGFVEFETHEQALVCLRQLNNNPAAFASADRRPIVEFAVESVKILKIRDRKIRLQQEQLAQRAQAETAPAEGLSAGMDYSACLLLWPLVVFVLSDIPAKHLVSVESFAFCPHLVQLCKLLAVDRKSVV